MSFCTNYNGYLFAHVHIVLSSIKIFLLKNNISTSVLNFNRKGSTLIFYIYM